MRNNPCPCRIQFKGFIRHAYKNIVAKAHIYKGLYTMQEIVNPGQLALLHLAPPLTHAEWQAE